MTGEHHKSKFEWHKTTFIVGAGLCLAVWFIVGYEFYTIRLEHGFSPRAILHGNIWTARRQHASPTSANFIQTWMTFDYINSIYHLPPDLLSGSLAIKDTHYPHITLKKYIVENHLNSTTFLGQVRTIVSDHMTQH